jgi:hypothetical protein
MRGNLRLTVVVAVAVASSGCGSGSDVTLRSPGTDATTTAPATAETPTTAATNTTTTLPGEPFDPWHTPAGAVLDVAGVAFDETLPVHALPGSDQPLVASLPPLARGIVSTGRGRLLEVGFGGIWLEVTADGVTGWVVSNRLVYLGGPRDVTADVFPPDAAAPTAPSMLELGRMVTDALVPSDPTSLPTIVVAAAPGAGPTFEVIYDTFPGELFGGDTSIGSRYLVTGHEVTAGGLPPTGFAGRVAYELVGVESIELCTRGVTGDGLCV